MKQNNGFVAAFILIMCEIISSQFIRPITSELKANPRETMSPKESISVFDMIHSRSIIIIDLNRPLRQQSIVLRNSRTVKLTIFCSINIPITIKKSDVKMQFCYQTSLSQDGVCEDLVKIKGITSLFNMKLRAKSSKNGSGFIITLDSHESNDNDLSGYYYCRFDTISSGMVLSNVMEIRDILYWEKNLIVAPPQSVREKYQQSLDISQVPKSFECINQVNSHIAKDIPLWTELEFKSIVKWAWCPVSKQRPNLMELEKTYIDDCLSQSISKCDKPTKLCPRKLNDMPGWIEFNSFNGTIILIKGQKFSDQGNTLDGYALMCYYKSKENFKVLRYIAFDYGNTQFLKGLQWENKANERKSIEVKGSTKQIIRVGILKTGFILTAFYNSPSNFTYEWKRNQNTIYNSSEWIVTPFSLHYRMKIQLKDEGEYVLQLKSGDEVVTFCFVILVQSPPFLVNVPVPIIYNMVGSNLSLIYQYKGRPTNMQIYINGLPYKPNESNRKIFMNDLTKKSFYLKDLNFSVSRKSIPNNLVELVYNVSKLSYSDMVRLAEDHSLIIEARNEYGLTRSHINVYVLTTPVYVNLPANDNCTVICSSDQPHLFRCEINDDYYISREVIVEKYWMVNGIRVDSLPYYSIYFKEDSKGLHMSSVNTNMSEYDIALKLLFKKANLVCRLRLLYPGSLGMSENDLVRDKRIIFDSINDPYFVSNSVALVSLDWEPTIATASYTWVVFLIIALLLITMFIFLLVRLTLRDQGKSYQIEKLEIAKGINRDEEIIENETIRPYVRSQFDFHSVGCQIDLVPVVTVHYRLDGPKAPVLCSNCIAFEDCNGNKSATNKAFIQGYKPQEALDVIDDEEELEDASKFNEEGSFIGVYASKDKVAPRALSDDSKTKV